jgi:hypothetical protein
MPQYTVTIDSSFHASPEAVAANNSDTVLFVNNSPVAVSINPGSNPATVGYTLPSNLNVPADSQAEMRLAFSPTFNYYVVPVGTSGGYGPYSVHIRGIAIGIDITGGNAQSVVIPANGFVEFIAQDDTYGISWGTPANPFSPAITTVAPLTRQSSQAIATGNFGYTISPPPGKHTKKSGGTVKVAGASRK